MYPATPRPAPTTHRHLADIRTTGRISTLLSTIPMISRATGGAVNSYILCHL
ncbi:hypothetical protein HYPSUDRAFT_1021300 [Hypholoma sublateritium FD-334 SS-4]|uniref:Uncharacterized protein n=1 Tax=Hypholoma sublateritium (strain FD-334 SS-4) TaxID=945553 RepID=A0A0D2NL80_HYPSF|nr:hypothetical protein HYPSUDRAFT_1021074 [Hypholoma sublateritium FD-334 SS-4]KJA17385.1 hypothetical protein HYPSUDRAFT_1021300 [Hypholoma sublateritium FD-334 SS-4]